jgi:hypothetical protein
VAKVQNGPGRRAPLELILLGAACLVCCLPWLAGLATAGAGVLAGLAATGLGMGLGLAIGTAGGAGVLAVGVWLWLRRRAVRCSTCGGSQCAC